MRTLSLRDLVDLAEERAEEDRKAVGKILLKSKATLLSIRNVVERLPDKGLYDETKAEASFKAKVLGMLGAVAPPSEPGTLAIDEFVADLNHFQTDVAKIGARLIPKFDRSRKLDVAELELCMRELAREAAQLQSMPKEALRRAEEAKRIAERIAGLREELKRLGGMMDSVDLETGKLKEEEARLKLEAAKLEGSELASRLKNIDEEASAAKKELEGLFAPIAKPVEKLKKALEGKGIQEPRVEMLSKCVENPFEILKIEFAELEKAGQVLRGYIERGELPMKASRSKRALQSISEMGSKAPGLKERLVLLLDSAEEMSKSPEVGEFAAKRKDLEERLKQVGQRLGALEMEKANLDGKIAGCSSKIGQLRKEAEKLAEEIVSEPSSITI
ncbi:MAG: hypothetical protein JTT11_06170 [Candidatus Brockarchaeota archaeon]|nr:hypothetical protein [Candidatus Brockarchaeota archaeon]